MRSSKDRTIEKKKRNKAMKVQKTEKSRRKRLANKHKRKEIHAIDPDMKVVVMNQRTFDGYGTEIEVIDGKIKAVTPADYNDAVIEYQEVMDVEGDGGRAIDDQIEKERIGMFDKLAERFRKK